MGTVALELVLGALEQPTWLWSHEWARAAAAGRRLFAAVGGMAALHQRAGDAAAFHEWQSILEWHPVWPPEWDELVTSPGSPVSYIGGDSSPSYVFPPSPATPHTARGDWDSASS